ncbi:protein SFI1 homolog isoform X4 [Bubalus bubalis]|uniref:protein SFI1 homolog isoform X4 n=1 Tax=Bubalus bubalis TaxID=89462 RepID=UPI001D11F388|nr:protein SFI1 homolog isoform X4 [Bubalus bubalis]
MKNLLTEKCASSHWLNFQQKKIKQRMERKVDSRSFRDSAVKKPYSPKILSTKKPSAFSGSRSEVSRASHPVKYHPSQARTRRGRLRELRVRCVARKYFHLWIRMTFGRVFPSKARLYYKQKILRKVFEEWKEEWWVSHREWKLRVRADCHYRYYLYSLMFQTWKTYVYQQREMRSKYLRAENHDAKQNMRRAWKSWLVYVVFRRTKLEMQTTALEFRQRSILWVWWSAWRRRLGQVRLGRALQATAVKHRAQSLQLQAWSRWQEQLLFVRRERRKTVSAVTHLQRRQQWRALRAWLEYLQLRREKRLRNQMAEQVQRATLLQMHFSAWRQAWAWRESLHAHHARVEGLARRTLLRRALTRWKRYMLLCAEEVEWWKAAGEHYRRGLLHLCFKALKDNVTHARLQRIRRNLAHQQHDVMLLHRVWNLWQSRLEQREEREQLPFLRAAWDHSRITLLRKCFQLWSRSTQKRRSQQLLQARADGHFQQRALPAAFQTWRRLWRWRQQQRALEAQAACFHREMLEKQVFAIWCQKMSQHREHRLAERMAVLHAELHLLQKSWSMWRQQAAAHCLEQQQHALACAHHHLGRLRKAFCVWREGARGLRTERTGTMRAARFHAAWLLRRAWTRWREVYQSRVRSVLQEAAARESRHKRRLLRRVFRCWRENAMAQVDEAKKMSQAAAHYRRTLCSKVLLEWREAASVQVYYREQADGAVREAQLVLSRGRLRTWFRLWRDRSRRAAQQRVQMERALRHCCRKLLQEALARWKAHHQGCVRKRLWQRQAARLRAQTLSRACFHQWRRQLLDRRHERQRTARALWFWAFSLQAKAWAAWRGFVQEARRKKEREEQAVQVYHLQLLREGVERLLRFAAGMKAFRQQLHAQQQVQAAHSLHRAVHRCATLWKQKALGRGRELQSPASTEPSRRVTFERPLLSHVAAGAGDAPLEPKRPPAPRGLWGALDGLASAPGDPQLLELNAARWARKQPRRPSFLVEPLQSQAPLGCGPLSRQGSQALWECGPHQVRPVGPAWSVLDPSSPLPRAPGLKLPPTAHPSPELLPPSSFAPRGAQVPVWLPAQPVTRGLPSQVRSSLAGVPSSCLLLPGDFRGTRPGPGSDPAGVYQGPVSASRGGTPPGSSAHPGLSQEAGRNQAHSPVGTGHSDLEAELEGIRQQLQDYQTTRQNLRSCQRQAHSLRRWLELSREEPRAEDQEAEQQVEEELQKVRRGRLGRLLGWASSQLVPRPPRWRCRSSSWPTSCRPGASPSTPASLGSRPCGGLCASHHVQEQNAEQQCFLVYFKMLQLNESLFRSLPLFIQKYCATDTVEKVQVASPAGEIHSIPRKHETWPPPRPPSVAPSGFRTC